MLILLRRHGLILMVGRSLPRSPSSEDVPSALEVLTGLSALAVRPVSSDLAEVTEWEGLVRGGAGVAWMRPSDAAAGPDGDAVKSALLAVGMNVWPPDDDHVSYAAELYGVRREDVTPAMRSVAKADAFRKLYGQKPG